jgi:hypothetical protein
MSEIDWSTAEVRDGKLSVELTEKPSKEWRERLTGVVERLGRDGVAIKKERLVVEEVAPGTEGDVRHLLESAVLQVNADLAPDEPDEPADERSDADREMTDAFRAFAPAE